MFKKLIAAYRKVRRILSDFDRVVLHQGSQDAQLRTLRARVAGLENELRKRTEIAVDVGFPGCYAIVVGRLGGRTFIQTYSVEGQSFRGLVDQLKEMERYAHVARVDAPPSFRGVFEQEFGL